MSLSCAGESDSRKILFVGLCCFDIVIVCKAYPEEDSDQKCLSHRWQRGGNASNSCTVLSALNVPCEYLGTLSSDFSGCYLRKDFAEHGISTENCILYKEYDSPVSSVIVNIQNGSRTIMHCNRNLPELSCQHFEKLDLTKYKWVHFEGRNVTEVKKMINHVNSWNEKNPDKKVPVSVELEKPKPSIDELLGFGDIVFIGKDFAKMHGHKSMENAVKSFSKMFKPGVILICAWGDKGACAQDVDGAIVSSPAYPPSKVVDTLAAGDTFIAATVSALDDKRSLSNAITFGCQVAGYKCGLHGFQGLATAFSLKRSSVISSTE